MNENRKILKIINYAKPSIVIIEIVIAGLLLPTLTSINPDYVFAEGAVTAIVIMITILFWVISLLRIK
jgi:hypothetical protein